MYLLLPGPNIYFTEEFAYWDDAFTREDLEKIIQLGESKALSEAKIFKSNIAKDIRDSKISWISYNQESGWLFEKFAWIIRNLNAQYFGFDLTGMYEDFQFTTYEANGDSQGHYTWHMDRGSPKGVERKLSLVLQLSDPYEYEGGELQIFTRSKEQSMLKKRGIVHAFPSFTMHRVTPVTNGIRKTLVCWVGGPNFR